ncbi:hypothetical protein [Megasphaera paucivorans]|nr:hypothetical protein [Megasphaera paucivorans]
MPEQESDRPDTAARCLARLRKRRGSEGGNWVCVYGNGSNGD